MILYGVFGYVSGHDSDLFSLYLRGNYFIDINTIQSYKGSILIYVISFLLYLCHDIHKTSFLFSSLLVSFKAFGLN